MKKSIDWIITELHGEYTLPEMEGVTIRTIFSGFECSEYLRTAGVDMTNESELCLKSLNQILKEHDRHDKYPRGYKEITNLEDNDDHLIIVYRVTFWEKKHIKPWVEHRLAAAVENAMQEASGDDTFYDYMPSFVDTYRQACDYLNKREDYDNLILSYHDKWTEEGDCPLWIKPSN